MSFELEIEATKVLKLWQPLESILQNVDVLCTEEGLHIRSFSHINGILVDSKVPAKSFVKFVISKPIMFGMSLKTLMKMYSKYKTHTIRMTYNTKHNVMQINVLGTQLEFEMLLVSDSIRYDVEDYVKTDINYPNVVQLKADRFKNIIHQCYQLTRSINIQLSTDFIQFAVDDDDFLSGSIKLLSSKENANGNNDLLSLDVKSHSDNVYNISLLHTMLQKCNFRREDVLYIFNGPDIPIQIHVQWLGVGFNKLYIAPKVKTASQEATNEEREEVTKTASDKNNDSVGSSTNNPPAAVQVNDKTTNPLPTRVRQKHIDIGTVEEIFGLPPFDFLETPASTTHELLIKDFLLVMIDDGRKTVESRLSTAPYKSIKPGDYLQFKSGQKMTTKKVRHVSRYNSYRQMLEAEGIQQCLPGVKDIDEAIAFYEQLQTKGGLEVLAFRLE